MHESADSSSFDCTSGSKMHRWTSVLLLVVIAFVSASLARVGTPHKCPDGQIATGPCIGPHKKCPMGYYCHYGYCCRSVPPVDKCPPPPVCAGYVASLVCVTSHTCPHGQICCPDGCGNKMCMNPYLA